VFYDNNKTPVLATPVIKRPIINLRCWRYRTI